MHNQIPLGATSTGTTYIFPFLTGGVTIRVEVFRGGVWCYASDIN